jgi:hypothetical protein
MTAAVRSYLDPAITSLTEVVNAGAPSLGSSKHAVAEIQAVEQTRRLAAIAAVDLLAQIDASRTFYDHGHVSARVMFEHVAGVSSAESHRLDQIRRMIIDAALIAAVWRKADLSVDKAALLGRTFANPRTRDRFLIDQKWFLKQAHRYGMHRLTKKVARWLEVHDSDGPEPAADPSFGRRRAWLSQDHFSKVWKLDAQLGSLQGSSFNQVFRAYVQAEFNHDWSQAEKIHGADTCTDLLARSNEQRCADALCQIAIDAANSDKPSAPVKRVHNIVWTADAYEELLRRWINAPARLLDPDTYNITDIDGHPIAAQAAFADSLVSSLRRVVQNASGVTIDMSSETRLFTGLARLGVVLATAECYWPGCHVPTSRCHIDHLKPAARGGLTNQLNGLPSCPRHNWLKERGYTVHRQPDRDITITTPNGDTIR